MINRPLALRGAFLGLVLIMATASFCEDETGRICGKVVKPNGKPAKKAEVILLSHVGAYLKGIGYAKTDKHGAFCFKGVEPGDYVIDAEYFNRFDGFLCRSEIRLEQRSIQGVELKLEKHDFMGCREAMIRLDEPIMTRVFSLVDLEEIPIGTASGR